MSVQYPRVLACGDTAVSIEFGDRIDDRLNAQVMALDRALANRPIEGVIEAVPTYRSLLVHYDPVALSFADVSNHALSLIAADNAIGQPGRQLTVPVIYGGACGIDLEFVAAQAGIAVSELIARHSAVTYRVHMLGFQPGFAYLGGLDPILATPRRAQPRPNAPAGTISIGGAQSAVHSVEGPSGWHWIGRTPLQTYQPGRLPRFLFEPGDCIRFEPVSMKQWERLSQSGVAQNANAWEFARCPA